MFRTKAARRFIPFLIVIIAIFLITGYGRAETVNEPVAGAESLSSTSGGETDSGAAAPVESTSSSAGDAGGVAADADKSASASNGKKGGDVVAATQSLSAPGGGASAGGSSSIGGNVSVMPDLFSGAMSYSIPIEVSPGRKGMQPGLALTYRSSNGNGWVGVGWDLDVGAIERSACSGINYSGSEYILR